MKFRISDKFCQKCIFLAILNLEMQWKDFFILALGIYLFHVTLPMFYNGSIFLESNLDVLMLKTLLFYVQKVVVQ